MSAIALQSSENSTSGNESWVKPMKDYNQNSSFQAQLNVPNCSILMEQARQVSDLFQTEFHLADFGCSHGKNSMECVKAAFDGYTAVPQSIRVYLNDLPTNEFGEVFKCLNDPEISYNQHILAKQSKVSTCVNGQSFSEQCFPTNHLHLAYSFNCLHWLEKPAQLKEAIITSSQRVTPQEAETLAKDAHVQLVSFLNSRSKELQRGGRLVLSFTKKGVQLDPIDDAWASFIQKKGYSLDQFTNVAIPVYNRSDEEIQAALDQVKGSLKVLLNDSSRQSEAHLGVDVLKSTSYNSLLSGLQKTNLFGFKECEDFLSEFFDSCEITGVEGIPLHTLVLERI